MWSSDTACGEPAARNAGGREGWARVSEGGVGWCGRGENAGARRLEGDWEGDRA